MSGTGDRALYIHAPAGLPFIDVRREFDAPVSAVFRAHAEPESVVRWLGPAGYEMSVEEYDFRSGGRYRYVHRDPGGVEHAFHGVFHTVRTNQFAVQTFEYEGFPDVVSIEFLTFVDLGHRCRLEGHSVYPTLEARDGMAASGMEKGMREGYERLDDLLG